MKKNQEKNSMRKSLILKIHKQIQYNKNKKVKIYKIILIKIHKKEALKKYHKNHNKIKMENQILIQTRKMSNLLLFKINKTFIKINK